MKVNSPLGSILLGSTLLVLLLSYLPLHAQEWQWDNVNLQGMGFVTGIVAHPTASDVVYARTDVGGVFRWEEDTESWTPLMDGKGISQDVESVAIDPENEDLVYATVGEREYNTVYKSPDRGQTWEPLYLAVYVEGNGAWRHGGERLSVLGDRMYYGSRRDGLWQSQDGGYYWRQINITVVPVGTDGGQTFTLMHPSQPTTAYVGVQGSGVYQTTDDGQTWHLLEGGPEVRFRPVHGTIAHDGTLYVTYADGPGENASGRVYKYGGAGTLQDVTPDQRTNQGFAGISVRPDNSQEVLTFQWAFGPTEGIHRSTDGGANWSPLPFDTEGNVTEPAYYPSWTSYTNAGQILLDPTDRNRAWMTTGFAVYQSNNICQKSSDWVVENENLEEFVCLALKAPPAQPRELILGVADMVGMALSRFDEVPQKKFYPDAFGVISGIAYCETQPQHIAYVGSSQYGAVDPYTGISRDGGLTWSPFPSVPAGAQNGNVAISSRDPEAMVWAPMSESNLGLPTDERTVLLHYTRDGGQTWYPSSGAPNRVESLRQYWFGSESLVADPVDGSTFYLYDLGNIYRSEDHGATWSVVGTVPVNYYKVVMKARPGVFGELYLTNKDDDMLYRSSDAGASWEAIPSLLDGSNFAFGRAPNEERAYVLYAVGKVDNQLGIYWLDEAGGAWQAIDTEGLPLNKITTLEASKETYGRLFFGTGGRGFFAGAVEGECTTDSLSANTHETTSGEGSSWREGDVSTGAEAISVYPNPVRNGRLRVRIPSASTAEVTMYSLTGEVVLRQPLSSAASITVPNLPPGVYTVLVRTSKLNYRQRILVNTP